jgi:hypothetical protein
LKASLLKFKDSDLETFKSTIASAVAEIKEAQAFMKQHKGFTSSASVCE